MEKNGKNHILHLQEKNYGNWINNEPHGNGYFEIDSDKYNIVFRFGKIISSK